MLQVNRCVPRPRHQKPTNDAARMPTTANSISSAAESMPRQRQSQAFSIGGSCCESSLVQPLANNDPCVAWKRSTCQGCIQKLMRITANVYGDGSSVLRQTD